MKQYVLFLANVHSNVDNYVPVATSTDLEKLKRWEQEQRAETPYTSSDEHSDDFGSVHGYTLTYKPDSPLQWYNPIDDFGAGFREYEVDEFKNILGAIIVK